MATEQRVLVAVPVPGLRPEHLGNYLASLGLLRILARRWPSVRAGWNRGVLHLAGGPKSMDEILEVLCDVAAKRAWTPYERGWGDAQKQGTKKKSGRPLAVWQASAEERDLELFTAHAVPAAKISFNPILGSGGNAGKRNFAEGRGRAVEALMTGERTKKCTELKALLLGNPLMWLVEKLNAACWFSDTNKLYNSGQRPFREGAASPWAMVLACEGLAFFAGGGIATIGLPVTRRWCVSVRHTWCGTTDGR